MTQKQLTKEEFIERFTDLSVKVLSQMTPEEQERRLQAAERRLSSRNGSSSNSSYTGHTHPTPLVAQSPRSKE
jgi:hypothetical protein